MQDVAAAAAARLRAAHADAIRETGAAADRVAAARDGPATDRSDVVDPLAAELRRRGLLERYPRLLADAADAAGCALPAEPVAAPPYVAVTSRGPVLRATLDPCRLVVTLAVFDVERGRDGVRYVRSRGDPLSVECR